MALQLNRSRARDGVNTIRNKEFLVKIWEKSKYFSLSKMLYEVDLSVPIQQCCVQTYNRLYPCDIFEVCTKTFNNEKKWLEQRKFRITGTWCYSLFTYNQDDWDRKAFQYFYPKQFTGNSGTNYGKQQEHYARIEYSAYLQEGKHIVEYGLVICYGNPWLACSPDGILLASNGESIVLIEIKCPVIGQKENIIHCLPKLNFMKATGQCYKLKERHTYYAQI